ncbi:cancer-associated gene 1 protein isoform X2 [Suricata suricatta]|uniref:cancer-associated gene 1 protein isoform X2 n=1 Tax=Suricata suricatta TaxID=37032 RepID=UPI0011556880|nr:cancer-associated gene 1 protein isoform X2 [Suricata suricatta]
MDPGNPLHFEVDASHEKLESTLEADTVIVSSLNQDLTHSESPFYMDTSSANSDLPQNEIKNIRREDESECILSEEIYTTLDNWLGDVDIGNDSQNVLTQQVDPSISSFRQFEPICKFHHTEAFSNEMITFQNLNGGLPHIVQPEMQSHVYNSAKDTNIKEDSFKEENPLETSTSINEEQFAHECVRQPSRSPPVVHGSGETVKFMEMSRAKSAATQSALKPSQPQSVWYATEKTVVSSKGTQSFGDIPEMPVSHQKEVTVEDPDSPGTVSSWSPAGISWSGEACQEDGKAPDMEQSLESLQPVKEDMALNKVLRKLKHTNKRQQTLIQGLQCSNKNLEKKVKELQKQAAKQDVFVDIINQLKEKVEELIEDKYRVMLEKNDTDRTLQNLHEVLTNTQKHLQESRNEKETLQLELKKIKGNYIHLQERYMTEMQQRDKTISEYMEMNRTLSKKEEVDSLKQLQGELEKATTSSLNLLKRERKTQEQEFLSLQEEFQKHEKENLEERQELKSRLEKPLTQVNHLQFISENEQAKSAKLSALKHGNENARLQQQVARSEEQSPQFETVHLKEYPREAVEADITKEAKMIRSHVFPNYSPGEEVSLSPPDVKTTSQLVSKLHRLLALVIGLLTCQDISTTNTEHFKDSEKISDVMLQKLKRFHLKKKNLDQELLKHKDRITTFRELITNEKAFQDRVIEVTGFDSDDAKNIGDVFILLGARLNMYHSLNEELDCLIPKLGGLLKSKADQCYRLTEENDKYQRHLGNLINKATSHEDMIKCADQRLEISHSQIALPRRLENRPKSLTVLVAKPRKMKLSHPCSLPCSIRLKQTEIVIKI